MKLQRFDGGLATRLAPQMLNLDEAVEYLNVDSTSGTLVGVADKQPAALYTERFAYLYEATGEWLSSATKRDYVEFQNSLYYTDRVGGLRRRTGSTDTNAGIANPSAAVTLTAASAPGKPTAVTALVEDSGTADIPAQTHSYMLVNVGDPYFSEGQIIKVDLSNGDVSTPSDFDFTVTDAPALQPLQQITTGYGQVTTIGTVLTGKQVTFSKVGGVAYGPGGINVYRLYNNEWRLLGNLVDSSSVLVDDVYDISSNALLDETKIGPLKGTYQYVYTYYNSSNGVESGPSPLSAELEVFGSIYVSSLVASPDTQVTHIRVYRVGGSLAEFTRVAEVSTAAPFVDAVKDVDASGLLTTEIFSAAPAGLKYLTEAYAMLFGALDSSVMFTPVGVPHAWPVQYFIQYDAPITGLAAVANGVLVFTKYRTHIITGTGPVSLSSQLLSGDQGCVSHDSVQVRSGAAVWVSTDGLCSSSGNFVTVVSKDKLGKIALAPVDSVLFDEVYYCLTESGHILALDMRFKPIFKELALGVTALAKGNDTLYGWSEGQQYALFSSTTRLAFTWKSPRFIEGRATENKLYKKVYIYSKGPIIIEVYINDARVISKALADEDGHVIQVPQELQRGFFIQFVITGTGEVYELEYEAARRYE